jgi:glycosyltransferase involved in cell wall biosynthesis
MKNKIVGVYRIKNEERWIAKSLESISDICSEVVILDDGSTDKTVEICSKHDKVVDIYQQKDLPFDETRDRNLLWKWLLKENLTSFYQWMEMRS